MGVFEMARRMKITKKKLKEPDEFISLAEKAYLFITRYLKPIVTGGIILLVLVLAFLFFQRWEKKNEVDADQKFSLAVQLYQRVSSPYREGSPAEYKNLLEKFDEVLSKFPRTSSGKLSLLYEGNIHLRLGEFEEAIKEYQAFLQKAGKEKLYRLLAMEGMGYAYEGMKDYEKALHAYQKILEIGESFQLADAYLNIGCCYEKLGKNKEALENYKAFLKISEKSPVANAVLRKISLLEK
jgi:tetratricopeptide (TPR) repeat protein